VVLGTGYHLVRIWHYFPEFCKRRRRQQQQSAGNFLLARYSVENPICVSESFVNSTSNIRATSSCSLNTLVRFQHRQWNSTMITYQSKRGCCRCVYVVPEIVSCNVNGHYWGYASLHGDILIKGWMTRQFALADQNQHVSKSTWVKLQCNRHSRSALKSVLKMTRLSPSEKSFLKGRTLIGHLYDI